MLGQLGYTRNSELRAKNKDTDTNCTLNTIFQYSCDCMYELNISEFNYYKDILIVSTWITQIIPETTN